MNLGDVTINKESQSQKDKYCMSQSTYVRQIG